MSTQRAWALVLAIWRPRLVVAIHAAWADTLKHMRAYQRKHGKPHGEAFARWQPDACAGTAGRVPTLWFIGNSVSRIHFFAALAILNTQEGYTQVGIPEQITQCGRGGEWKGRRPGQGLSCLGPCSCSDNVPKSNMSLVFVWQQQNWDPALNTILTGGRFSPNQSPVQAGDVVLLSTGLDPIYDLFKRSLTKKKSRGADGHLIQGNYTYFAERWRDTLRLHAEQLATSVAASWRSGRRVFWRTSTPDCFPTNATRNQFAPALMAGSSGRAVMESLGITSHSEWTNTLLDENDAVIRTALKRRGLPVIDMRELEAAASGCREVGCLCDGYVDSTRLHPGPLLAGQQVARLLAKTDQHCSA